MDVDHRPLHVPVAEHLLDRSNVVARFEETRPFRATGRVFGWHKWNVHSQYVFVKGDEILDFSWRVRLATALRCKVQSTENKTLNSNLRTDLTSSRPLTSGRWPLLPWYCGRSTLSRVKREG